MLALRQWAVTPCAAGLSLIRVVGRTQLTITTLNKGANMASGPTISLQDTSAEDAAAAARTALMNGGIVAFPTETVYGLAINGNHEAAKERLFALKGRDPSQRLARYVADSSAIEHSGFPLGLRARQLVRAFWPGPLTLVLENKDGATLGFRCSAHPVAALLGADLDLPALGTSANRSGEAPMRELDSIMQTLGESIALGIDHGAPLDGRASMVLSLPRTGGYRILREGDIDSDILKAELNLKICFVCTGNTCRSPLAESMFRKLIEERDLKGASPVSYTIASAGTGAAYGAPPSDNSYAVAMARGLDISGHLSQPISTSLLVECDLIVTMTSAQRDLLVNVLPECQDRVRPLALGEQDIADPFGGDLAAYRECADELERHLTLLLEEL